MPRIATTAAIATFAILTTVFPPSSVNAYEKFVAKIPNADSFKKIASIGHIDPDGGGPRNEFGLAFKKAGFVWTQALCEADTDGDGQTNGQELGDPCCSWVETGNLAYIRGISHPADPTSMVNPKYFASIECTKSAEALEKAAERAKLDAKKPKKPSTLRTTAPPDTADVEGSAAIGNSSTPTSSKDNKQTDSSDIGSGSSSSSITKKSRMGATDSTVPESGARSSLVIRTIMWSLVVTTVMLFTL